MGRFLDWLDQLLTPVSEVLSGNPLNQSRNLIEKHHRLQKDFSWMMLFTDSGMDGCDTCDGGD